MKRIKTITSYAGYARFLAEVEDVPRGYLPRCHTSEIPSPYMSSPTRQVLDWNGRRIIVSEVSHRRFEVFELPTRMCLFATEELAEDYQTRFGTPPPIGLSASLAQISANLR